MHLGRLQSATVATTARKIKMIAERFGPKPFGDFKILMIGPVWLRLDTLLPLLETMRATGFEPATEDFKPEARIQHISTRGRTTLRQRPASSSIFKMGSRNQGPLQEILERALVLGRRARDESWSKEDLIEEFEAFIRRKGKDSKPSKNKKGPK